ncbi:hypothetical protein [Noviherbaspirillum suwonense]|uniref:Uncharacterized protein n=1 Tax=Noviherbaspirillum suwonense TaxID=1224511 RepID=A0ABY1QN12_9BURK|nr:hypothetical protein [Noviherbaspirillum suwonense]SMP73159.1 hypothetical protein SAMN06295970_11918 [Noviherbaspirillum suwonense]
MNSISQKRAIENYRKRLTERGLARFEVLGSENDRDLIRSIARRLSEESAEVAKLRAALKLALTPGDEKRGGIVQALRRSPLVGAELDLSRPLPVPRKVDL